MPMPAPLHGHCVPAFAALRDELARNLGERGVSGAAVCVTHRGEEVVDLWGGHRDADGAIPWTADTATYVFSCSKALTAILAHLLASAGELELDAPVARYWPQFAAQGKRALPVRALLNHQAGLPGLRRSMALPQLLDWETMTGALAAETPFWAPGNGFCCYHATTFGWLVGEVVRRVGGASVGELLQRELAGPLDAEAWIGFPEAEESRLAPLLRTPSYALDWEERPHEPPGLRRALLQAVDNSARAFYAPGGIGSRAARAAQVPGLNAIATARGLARIFRPLALDGGFGGVRLVAPEQLVAMGASESAAVEELVGGAPMRYSAGFQKTPPALRAPSGKAAALRLAEEAFGHLGLGGALCFADPRAQLSFGYVTGTQQDEPAQYQRLVDAAYRAVGWVAGRDGRWLAPSRLSVS